MTTPPTDPLETDRAAIHGAALDIVIDVLAIITFALYALNIIL